MFFFLIIFYIFVNQEQTEMQIEKSISVDVGQQAACRPGVSWMAKIQNTQDKYLLNKINLHF